MSIFVNINEERCELDSCLSYALQKHFYFPSSKTLSSIDDNDDCENNDDEDEPEIPEIPIKKIGKSGRKARWNDCTLNDFVDIIVNDKKYQRKLIFTNTRNQQNSIVYEEIAKELKKRWASRNEAMDFSPASKQI